MVVVAVIVPADNPHFAFLQGLYQFLRPPSSPSPPLLRSAPVSLDYSKFGGATSPAVIPDDPDSAWWVWMLLFSRSHSLSFSSDTLSFFTFPTVCL